VQNDIGEEFWNQELREYDAEYREDFPSAQELASIEEELGYKLPLSYVALMRTQNGGYPARTCFPTTQPNNWADDHIAITGISGIGQANDSTLCGSGGSQFWVKEWGYPDIGIYFADCPTAGHQMVALDYRECGPQGEPSVVYVDQEDNYSIIQLAPSFTAFITGLVEEDELVSSGRIQ